ncbi:UDP-N-acetylmuramoyl-L-alanyl-D-glutamate--2,6-diaminopimelate ligase [Nitrospira sp.]|nr:UDP-N-acetylmuramoyl-L-alanyl-D-glutamate--2,6-diaminopimelate ligase [Nitrospira sp.]
MTAAELIEPIEADLRVVSRTGSLAVPVANLTDDSRRVSPGTLFVAVKGERVDGHRFIPQAVRDGAAAIVAQDDPGRLTIPVVRVADSRRAVGLLGSSYFGNPSAGLRMIGVTGTNGKTTITYLCRAILESIGRRVGVIGTVAYEIGGERVPASHTTPGALELQQLLARMVSANLDSVAMEVSSHALALDRTIGCEYDVAVFTNLTQDHLDFHRDMDDYFAAKLRLFTGLHDQGRKPKTKRAIVNLDDPRGVRIKQAVTVPVWTYGLNPAADLRAEDVQLSVSGTTFSLVTPVGRARVMSNLVGEHNIYNALAAIGVGLHEGISLEAVCRGVAAVGNVPGRFERVDAGQAFTVVVDYAHTEDALVNLLAAAQRLKTGRIITVFGCGGDRDRTKRPKMGRAAVEGSDVVVLTSDNPRTEDPDVILRDVEVGVKEALHRAPHVHYRMVADRREAIHAAVREAQPGDMVLIAGKGHEDYQIIGTTKHHFDDREVAQDAIRSIRVW